MPYMTLQQAALFLTTAKQDLEQVLAWVEEDTYALGDRWNVFSKTVALIDECSLHTHETLAFRYLYDSVTLLLKAKELLGDLDCWAPSNHTAAISMIRDASHKVDSALTVLSR
jgi:hypothetical protein